jgi:hypothetical protein
LKLKLNSLIRFKFYYQIEGSNNKLN